MSNLDNNEQQMSIDELLTADYQPATVESLPVNADVSDLPRGWRKIPLAESVEIVRGVTFSKSDRRDEPIEDYIPCLRTSNIQEEIEIDDLAYIPRSLVKRDDRFVQPGDVIISMSNSAELVGKVAKAKSQHSGFAFGAFLSALRSTVLDSDFLYYLFRSTDVQRQLRATASQTVNIANLSLTSMGKILLPLPPLDEQRRIVATLDRLFARSKRAREELERVPRLVERMRQAVLAAAFRGELTADWRTSTGLTPSIEIRLEMTEPYYTTFNAPRSWQETSIDGVCRIVGGSQPPKATFKYNSEPGYIRLIQIRDYKTDAHKTYIPIDTAKRFCTASDVMIGRYGPPIFQILRGLEGAYNVALMKAEPKEGCLNDFLFWRLQDPHLIRYVEIGSDRTAGQDGVNKFHLLKYPIFLPGIDEQAKIVRRIEAAFANIDAMAAEAARATALLDRLEQATLAKAFRGELVGSVTG